MKTIYESILSSTKTGKSTIYKNNPLEFAKDFFKSNYAFTPKSNGNDLHITSFSAKTVTIDSNFPELDYTIGSLESSIDRVKIVIKDYEIFRKYFKYSYGKVKIGGKRADIVFDDPNAELHTYDLYKYDFSGRLIIKSAKLVSFEEFPNVESIVVYKKNIQHCLLPIKNEIKLIEIK
jgi:hypothetical protein